MKIIKNVVFFEAYLVLLAFIIQKAGIRSRPQIEGKLLAPHFEMCTNQTVT